MLECLSRKAHYGTTTPLPAVPSAKFTERTSEVIFTWGESSGRTNSAHTCTGFVAAPSRKIASGRIRAVCGIKVCFLKLT